MGCLYNREEHVLTVVLGRKEVLAPAAQLVRCARPALRLGLRLVAASSLRLRLPAWAVVGTSIHTIRQLRCKSPLNAAGTHLTCCMV